MADININTKLEAGRHLDPFVKVTLRPVKGKKNDTQWLDSHQQVGTVMKDEWSVGQIQTGEES